MRRDGWEARFTDLLTAVQDREFQYGTWDCCLFAGAAIEALTGDNPADAYRGRYDDEPSCRAVLEAEGGLLGIADAVALLRNFNRLPVLMARRGDIVLGRIDDRPTLGVCVGASVWFAVAPRGVCPIPITDPALVCAWRIA